MKSCLGVMRKIDELGRIAIPIELRKALNLNAKDGLVMYVDGDSLVLQKYEKSQKTIIFCTEYL